MSELQPTDYLRVDEIDRAHAAASYINRTLFSAEEVAFRDAIQMTQEVILELTPVQQAENTLMRKTAEDATIAYVTPLLEEAYNWNPDKAQAMSAEEFTAVAGEYIRLRDKYGSLKTANEALVGTAEHFYTTGQLGGYTNEKDATWSFEAVMGAAGDTLWASDYVYSTLAMAKESYAEYVFKTGMQSYSDETYDFEQHYDEYRDIQDAKDEVSHWLNEARTMVDREATLAEFTMNQYVMQHADSTTKDYHDAKHALQYLSRYFTPNVWDEYTADVRRWCDLYGVELDEQPKYVWDISDEVLRAPDVEPTPVLQTITDAEASAIDGLADRLNDFHARSLDASVASRLISEGKADQVVENFHVFGGDTSKAASDLLEREGVGSVLDSLSRLHGLDNAFLRTLLDEWDTAWDKAYHEGYSGHSWEWPAGLYYPTEKMCRVIGNLGSFKEGSLDARMPFELVTRMGADRDHGGSSMSLVRELMKNVDRFEPFDHLELAKHYAKEVRVPHHYSWHEMLAEVIYDLDLPDTPEAQKFTQEVQEALYVDDDEYEDSDGLA